MVWKKKKQNVCQQHRWEQTERLKKITQHSYIAGWYGVRWTRLELIKSWYYYYYFFSVGQPLGMEPNWPKAGPVVVPCSTGVGEEGRHPSTNTRVCPYLLENWAIPIRSWRPLPGEALVVSRDGDKCVVDWKGLTKKQTHLFPPTHRGTHFWRRLWTSKP